MAADDLCRQGINKYDIDYNFLLIVIYYCFMDLLYTQ